jgi:hypothetical protein
MLGKENLTLLYRGPNLPYSILGYGEGRLSWNYLESIEKIKRETPISIRAVVRDGCTSIQMVGLPDDLVEVFKTFMNNQEKPLYVDSIDTLGVGKDVLSDYTSKIGCKVAIEVLKESGIEFKRIKDRLVLW